MFSPFGQWSIHPSRFASKQKDRSFFHPIKDSQTQDGISKMKTHASQTAIFAAANRALESEKRAEDRICYDPLAKKFIGPMAYLRFKGTRILQQRRGYSLQSQILYRCRYFDDYLQKCLASGTAQVVILGAGLDSRAYREEMPAHGVKVFEVDHPATQSNKTRVVKKVFGKLPEHIAYVPLDFTGETLDKLLAFGFNPSLKTLFLWEGVTFYLTAKAVDAILAWIPLHSAENSAVIFDYKYSSESRGNQPGRQKRKFSLLPDLQEERRTKGFRKDEIPNLLIPKGYHHILDIPVEELVGRYGAGSNPGRWGLKQFAIVSAETGKYSARG
jgi:methyltransferase (TIGR00027 family)